MCSNFFRCSNPWPYTYQKERIMKKTYLVPRKKTEKKCLLKSKLLQNRLCVFFRQNFSSHLHLKIFKKKNLCTWNKIIFFQGKRDLFSFKKKFYERHMKNFDFSVKISLKNQLSWIFLTCIPSSIAKPNRICTHKKIHLDFAYYSKKLQRLFRKKIIAFFPDFSTILAKKKFITLHMFFDCN